MVLMKAADQMSSEMGFQKLIRRNTVMGQPIRCTKLMCFVNPRFFSK